MKRTPTTLIAWIGPDVSRDRYTIYGELVDHGRDGRFQLVTLTTCYGVAVEHMLLHDSSVFQYTSEPTADIGELAAWVERFRGRRWAPEIVAAERAPQITQFAA